MGHTTEHQKSIAIVAVYEPHNLCSSVAIFERTFKECLIKDFKCIWKRPPEVKELTLEEVCKALGKNIKIVTKS